MWKLISFNFFIRIISNSKLYEQKCHFGPVQFFEQIFLQLYSEINENSI